MARHRAVIGDPRLPATGVGDKTRVDPDSGCWLWQAGLSHDGYPRFAMDAMYYAHVVVYTVIVGYPGEGLELDHLCRTRHSVNPDHLEPVTHAVNMLRGGEQYPGKGLNCKHGHPFSGSNLSMQGTKRRCRACQVRRSHEHYLRRKGVDA